MVADLGMEITSFRTDGGSHWRVDVRTPNGRQRPFTFPTRDNGNYHSKRNEEAALRRWRREVMPELDAAEEAGELRPPPTMQSTLAQKLDRLKIPLVRPEELQPQPTRNIVVMASAAPDESEPPSARKEVVALVNHPPVSIHRKEPVMQTPAASPTTSGPVNGGHAKKGVKNNFLGRAGEIKLADWLRVKGRLDGPTNSILLAEAASKELGMTITHSNVLGMLKDLGLEIKQTARANSGRHTTRHEYIAQCLIAVIEHSHGHVPDELLKVAMGEKEITFVNAPLPSWS